MRRFFASPEVLATGAILRLKPGDSVPYELGELGA